MSTDQNIDNKKRQSVSDSIDMESESESPIKEKLESFQIKELLQGITNIQNTLGNFMIRLDTQGRQIDDLTKEVKGKHGTQEQVELVQEQANDTMYTVTELGSNQEKMLREISRLREYVVKLEFRIYVQEKQILDLKAHSLENNIIFNGLDEKQPEK